MKKSHIVSALIMSALLAFASLSACGGQNSSEQSEAKLKIAFFDGGYGDDWMLELKRAYEYINKGAEITAVPIYDKENFASQISGGTSSYDMYFTVGHPYAYTHTKISAYGKEFDGYFADITDVYNYVPEGETLAVKDKLNDDYEAFANDGGKYNFISWAIGTQGITYHENYFTGNGWSVPLTTDSLIELAEDIKAADLKIKVDGAYKTVYPFIYCAEDEYWSYMMPIWFAQYEGKSGWDDYWNCIDGNGNQYTTEINSYTGMLRAFEVLSDIMLDEKGYNHYLAKSKSFDIMQSIYLDGQSVMMVNGDWMTNELKENNYDLTDVRLMKTPVISAIVEKLELYEDGTAAYSSLSAEKRKYYDDKLCAIIKDVDGGKSSSELCGNADFARISEARGMNASNGNLHFAGITAYSKNKDTAKDFLKFMYSDEGIRIYAKNTTGCGLPVKHDYASDAELSDSIDGFVKSAMEIYNDSTVIFQSQRKNPAFIYPQLSLDFISPLTKNFVSKFAADSGLADFWTAKTAFEKNAEQYRDPQVWTKFKEYYGIK